MTPDEHQATDTSDASATTQARAVPEPSHGILLRILAVALLVRAVLSFADAVAIATGGLDFLRLGGVAHADGSPVWPLLWGSVALVSAILLVFRRPLGWVLAAGVSVAYLVVGVAHAVDATSDTAGIPAGVWLIVAADVLVPSLVLAGLFTVRPWFLAAAREARPRTRGDGSPRGEAPIR